MKATRGSRRFILIAALCWSGTGLLHADALDSVAKTLAKGLATIPSHRIAVFPFQYRNGGISSGSSLVSERLITCLAQRPDVQVIERSLLSEVLGEIKIEDSGVTETTTTQKLGHILAVDAVVTGTLLDLDTHHTEVHARLIEIRSGKVLAATTARISRTWPDNPISPVAATSPSVLTTEMPLEAHFLALEESRTTPAASATFVANPTPEASSTTLPEMDSLIRNPKLPPNIVAVVRHIYASDPDPRLRAQALYALGIVLERQGQPHEAVAAYNQLLKEFPHEARLRSDAQGRLWAISLLH